MRTQVLVILLKTLSCPNLKNNNTSKSSPSFLKRDRFFPPPVDFAPKPTLGSGYFDVYLSANFFRFTTVLSTPLSFCYFFYTFCCFAFLSSVLFCLITPFSRFLRLHSRLFFLSLHSATCDISATLQVSTFLLPVILLYFWLVLRCPFILRHLYFDHLSSLCDPCLTCSSVINNLSHLYHSPFSLFLFISSLSVYIVYFSFLTIFIVVVVFLASLTSPQSPSQPMSLFLLRLLGLIFFLASSPFCHHSQFTILFFSPYPSFCFLSLSHLFLLSAFFHLTSSISVRIHFLPSSVTFLLFVIIHSTLFYCSSCFLS